MCVCVCVWGGGGGGGATVNYIRKNWKHGRENETGSQNHLTHRSRARNINKSRVFKSRQ